jgi:tocopherol O-methyltransferase
MSGVDGEVSVGKQRSDVAEFYDQISRAWEEDRGEHLHLGFYDVPPPPDDLLDHRAAAVRMVEETLKFAVISDEESKRPRRVVDVGCGMGGSSRYLTKKYGAHVEGITLSTWQVQRAIELTSAEGLSDKVSFQVADALEQPFPDGHFDLVWAMEIGEHMPDKEKFMQELVRVAAPGGSIIIVTCCHRDLLTGETSLQHSEQEHLDKIGRACCLSDWCSTADYVRMAQALSLQNIKTADWSENVAPFWSFALNKLGPALLQSGLKPVKGATPISLWVDGFKQNLVKYAVITAQKPA